MSRRTLSALPLVALAAEGLVVLSAPPASADAEDAVVGYDLAIDLNDDGVARVTLDLAIDFGEDPNRGPFLVYPVKQPFDELQDRVYRFTDIQVSSPSGAVDTVEVSENGTWLEIRVGEEDRDEFTGVQTYRFTYDVDGWVNTAAFFGPTTGLEDDQLYLNVLDSWELPVGAITVTVDGPAEVGEVACFTGVPLSTEPCDGATSQGATALFTQDLVEAGDALTITVAYPAGSITAEPVLQER